VRAALDIGQIINCKPNKLCPKRPQYIGGSVVTVTATSTATTVFICHRASTATEVEISASDGVAGQCITFIMTKRLRFRKLHIGFAHHQCPYIAVCGRRSSDCSPSPAVSSVTPV